jgi:hypothetical protein
MAALQAPAGSLESIGSAVNIRFIGRYTSKSCHAVVVFRMKLDYTFFVETIY